MKKSYNTETMQVAAINKILTVEMVAEVLSGNNGKPAMLLLAMLIWKREHEPHTWVKITNGQWKKHAKADRQAKYRGARALESAGLVEIRAEGQQTLQFKLAPPVDPRGLESKYAKKKAKEEKFSSPGMAAGDDILKKMEKTHH